MGWRSRIASNSILAAGSRAAGPGCAPGSRAWTMLPMLSSAPVYDTLEWLHILFAITAVGSNLTYAFWLARADADPEHVGFALRGVDWIDRRVANPAYGGIFVTGLLMAFSGRWDLRHNVFIALGLGGFSRVAPLARGVYAAAL